MNTLAAGEQLSDNKLGGNYPFWLIRDGKVDWSLFADEAVNSIPIEKRELDPVAVLSSLCFGYICLDRTLIKGLNRAPWFGSVDSEGRKTYFQAPPHGEQIIDHDRLSKMLIKALREEIGGLCQGYERVWCLLSGGMDSRVIAAIIHDLQRSGDVTSEIRAVTWGRENCRDIAYSRQIADAFGWEWFRIPLTAEDYWMNFERSAKFLAAEVIPNLHRIDWFSEIQSNDLVIAGSYGDGVGRAEYSSRHVSQLKGLNPVERYGLLSQKALNELLPILKRDILAIRDHHGERTELGWFEIERQAHYMRRGLSDILGMINRWGRLEQAFVAQSVFSIMWACSPSIRTNELYTELLRQLDPSMLEIPWSKTGTLYGSVSGEPDTLDKDFHQYGLWLRRDLADRMEHTLFEMNLDKLGLFNMNQLHWLFKSWKSEPKDSLTTLSVHLSWIAVLALFIDMYNVYLNEDYSDTMLTGSMSVIKKMQARVLHYGYNSLRSIRG